MFIINCKNYEEATGKNLIRLVNIAQKISKKYDINIAVAPPIHLAGLVADNITILAQHVDDVSVGSTTGFVVPELVKKSKINGSLINHSEHRISSAKIKNLVPRLKNLGLLSVVCVKDVAEAKRYAKLEPDYIAVEPSELIGSGKAISQERPELITGTASAISFAKNTKLLCGAGIVSKHDVSKAMELGAEGILVASGIVKEKNWNKIISEFAKSMI